MDGLILAVLVAVTAGLYAQTLKFNFINYDDNEYVFENQHVARLKVRVGEARVVTERIGSGEVTCGDAASRDGIRRCERSKQRGRQVRLAGAR